MQNDNPNRTQPDYSGLGPRSSRTGDTPAEHGTAASRPHVTTSSASTSSGSRSGTSSSADATINRMTMIAGALIFGAIALMLVIRDPARGPGDEPRAVTGAGQGTSGTTTNQSPIGGSVGVAPAPSGNAPVQPGSTPATPPR
jgi:preprotein translocase subunit SecG